MWRGRRKDKDGEGAGVSPAPWRNSGHRTCPTKPTSQPCSGQGRAGGSRRDASEHPRTPGLMLARPPWRGCRPLGEGSGLWPCPAWLSLSCQASDHIRPAVGTSWKAPGPRDRGEVGRGSPVLTQTALCSAEQRWGALQSSGEHLYWGSQNALGRLCLCMFSQNPAERGGWSMTSSPVPPLTSQTWF